MGTQWLCAGEDITLSVSRFNYLVVIVFCTVLERGVEDHNANT